MEKTEDNKRPSYIVEMFYDSKDSSERKNVNIGVKNENSKDAREDKQFPIPTKDSLVSTKEDICLFVAAALRRLSEKDPSHKHNMFSMRGGAFLPSTDGPAPDLRAHPVRVNGDTSIVDIFTSLIEMMDQLTTTIAKIFGDKTGTADRTFGKFFIIGNRAVSFTEDINPKRKADFLHNMESLAHIANELRNEIKDDVKRGSLSSLGDEDLDKFSIMLDDVLDDVKKTIAFKGTPSEIKAKRKEVIEKLTNLKDFAYDKGIQKKIKGPEDLDKRYDEIKKIAKLHSIRDFKDDLETTNNIERMQIDIQRTLKNLYGDEADNKWGVMASRLAAFMGYLTGQLQVLNLLKSYKENKDAVKQDVNVVLTARLKDYLEKEKMPVEEAFLFGAMMSRVMMDIRKVPLGSEDGLKMALKELEKLASKGKKI